MIRAVFFDLGKVLVDFDWKVAAQKLADRSGRSPDEILYVCTGSDLALRYELGLIRTDEFLRSLKDSIQFRESREMLAGLWSDIFTPIPGHVSILETVSKNYITGLISNTNALHFDFIESRFGWMNCFRRLSLSHRLGVVKPDIAIFQHAAEPFGLKPEQIVFIDDLERNLAGAKALGWHTIHYVPGKDLAGDLALLGVSVF